jgi:RHS repeat-associated protein
LGTVRDLGMLCEQSGFPDATIIERMNEKVIKAGHGLEDVYNIFEKNLVLQQPFLYNTRMQLICDGNHDPDRYAAYWYHPDHLGSSSYITNLDGEINQHMEYLPFGETLVEEHLNSYNSPFKFNAKELDAETGNYYYGARYYDPKWSVWLSVDAEFARFPSYSPYNYTLLNPINLVDPDGNAPAPIKRLLYSKSQGNTGSYTLNNFRFTPASNQSWSGSTTTGSIIQDGRSSLLGRILQSTYGGGEQYTRSVSEITTENKGQYYNVKGEIVDNITDASKVIISKYTKTETVNLYEGGILGNEVTVKESISIQTFDVLKDGNILFSDSFNDSVTKTKDITMASENLQQISTEEASKNKSKFGTQNAQRKANAIMGQMENIYHDAVIESKQDSYGN